MEKVENLKIVEKVMNLLGLSDSSKIEKFFKQEIKTCKEAIEALEINLQSIALLRKQEVSKSTNAIEDAKQVVEDAYLNIKVSDVETNALRASFSDIYWSNVLSAESALKALEIVAITQTEKYEVKKKEIEEQISKYKIRIEKLSK